MAKTSANNLVGRRVFIDYPIRWKDCRAEYRDQMRTEAEQKNPYFGEYGEIVSVHPDGEGSENFTIRLTGEVMDHHLGMLWNCEHAGFFTVVGDAKPDRTEELLQAILDAIKKLAHSIIGR